MAIAELVMPKLGESIMEATILKWHKKVGDYVKFDETVLEIATDKVDTEVPSTEQGIVTEILFQVNDVVPIGTVIARIQTSATTSSEPAPIQQQAEVPAASFIAPDIQPAVEEAVQTYPPVQSPDQIPYVPNIGSAIETKTSGTRFYSPLVLNIANSEGISLSELERIPGTGNEGRVSKKDVLQYVADKKAGRVPAYQAPVTPVAATVVPPVTSTVLPPVETAPTYAATVPAQTIASVPPVTTTTSYPEFVPESKVTPAPVQATGNPVSEANMNTDAGIPSDTGIITASYQPSNYSGKFSDPASVSLSGSTEIVEMDRMRKLIAKHMVDSKHISPHVTSFAEADVTNMVIWREKVKAEFEKREGTKLTYTPMFMECIASVIRNFPLINCSLEGDHIIIKKDINIGMATALPNGNLIVPVIKAADQLNIVGLSKAVNGLADAARNSRLKPEDTTGGTFTLTNVGSFGSLMGTPIIPQPQVAILAVGIIKKRPMVIEKPEGDTIGIRHMMYLSLSYDHRIVDGSIGASFLTAVAKAFEAWDPNKQWFHYL